MQAPDHKGIALWYADGVLKHQLVEAGGDRAKIEVRQALAHAVGPNLF